MPGTLTKADIITAIQTENGYPHKKSTDIVETLLEIINSSLESARMLWFQGLENFQVRDKKERRGRNPATNEDMRLPARRVVTFNCSGRSRDIINGG